MICPQCKNEVPVTEAQFLSMYTCGKCQAVYFIDITGQPEFGDMSLPIPEEPHQIEELNIHGENPDTNSLDSALQDSQLRSTLQANFELQLENQLQTKDSNEVTPNDSFESMVADSSSDQNPFEVPTTTENISDFNSTALEITDFANQDNAISALSYNLKISGLDTKETMMLFREAVNDSKFGWIAQEIFSTIKNGECEFKNLNPIQAFVLAKRIQFLDLEMEWKQNVQG